MVMASGDPAVADDEPTTAIGDPAEAIGTVGVEASDGVEVDGWETADALAGSMARLPF